MDTQYKFFCEAPAHACDASQTSKEIQKCVDNDYELNREMQRTVNYTGIVGINTQDRAVQESMGCIVDRTSEHLGTTDAAVIAFRKRLISLAMSLQEGIEPAAASNGDWYRVRSASAILNNNVVFDEGAAELLVATSAK